MSKFFDQSSSSSSESDSDNEIVVEQKTVKKSQMAMYDSEEDEKKTRVVLPEKAKRLEEINGLVKQLKNAKKIRDIVKANQLFEEMVKSYDKAKKITENEGHFKQYIRAISELEDYVVELWADNEWKKAASKNNATSLTKLRQRIRRYNKDYETEIADFKENPDNYPEEEKIVEAKDSESEGEKSEGGSESEEESEESGSDSDDSEKPVKKTPRKIAKDDDEDEDSEDWSLSDSDDSSDDSDLDLNQEDIWKKFLKQG
jgi:translation initiation factor 3 subunit C